jgi:hypothetical protein
MRVQSSHAPGSLASSHTASIRRRWRVRPKALTNPVLVRHRNRQGSDERRSAWLAARREPVCTPSASAWWQARRRRTYALLPCLEAVARASRSRLALSLVPRCRSASHKTTTALREGGPPAPPPGGNGASEPPIRDRGGLSRVSRTLHRRRSVRSTVPSSSTCAFPGGNEACSPCSSFLGSFGRAYSLQSAAYATSRDTRPSVRRSRGCADNRREAVDVEGRDALLIANSRCLLPLSA